MSECAGCAYTVCMGCAFIIAQAQFVDPFEFAWPLSALAWYWPFVLSYT